VLVWIGGGLLQLQHWTRPVGDPLAVSLVQANIPQSMKWEPAMRLPSLKKYAQLTRAHWESDLVIWPETAVPDFLHRVEEDFLQPLAEEAARHDTRLLVGVPMLDQETGRYYNGAWVAGRPGDVYYKRHLVPFGEFLPFEALLRPLLAFMEIPMSDFAAGRERRPIVHVGGTPVGVSICYEDAFGEEVMQALPEAAYLVNLSNDAWFGDSLAPHQHLQIARMRALETGRPLLRATNTGISALIGPRGEIIAATGAFEEVVLSGRIQPMAGATPFVRTGNGLAVGLMLAALGLALLLGRRLRVNA
jgi:apolipoprotein N-acyltransferase